MISYMESTGWTLISAVPSAAVNNPVWQALSVILIAIFVILAAFTLIVLIFIKSSIFRPIKRLSALAYDVAQGSLQINMGRHNVSKDEIGDLTLNIYNLVDIIKTISYDVLEFAYQQDEVGDYEFKMDPNKFKGAFKDLVEGIDKVPKGAEDEA